MKILFTLLLSLSVLASFAQQDAKAKEILDKVSAKTKSYSTIKVEYSFVHENLEDDIKEVSNGKLSLKGNKYVLDFMGNTVFCDSKTIWSYIKDANEVNISAIEEDSESLFNPANMFTVYEKGFKFTFVNERFEKGHALQVIDLFPENVEESEYSKIRISVDKDKNQIFKINYFGKDANRFIIEVTKFTANETMGDETFLFNKEKFPGVEIVDMR